MILSKDQNKNFQNYRGHIIYKMQDLIKFLDAI